MNTTLVRTIAKAYARHEDPDALAETMVPTYAPDEVSDALADWHTCEGADPLRTGWAAEFALAHQYHTDRHLQEN